MLKTRQIVGLFLLLFIGNYSFGQCPPAEKMIKAAAKTKSAYGVNSQSKTGALISGQSYDMAFIAQDNYDYRITVGTMDSKEGTVSFEVYEMITEKDANGKYAKVKKVIISSEEAESNTVEFITDKARKLMINVRFDDAEDQKPHCVAVLIEDKKTTKIGL
ncbi:MAG: hypothetical protein ACK5B9_05045 [Flavobacteriia bacterium]|jgi:hypothetical protein